MRDFMVALFACSGTMSVLALFYMMATPLITKHYSAKGRYYAWLVIVIGLIIPFRPRFHNALIQVNMPSEVAAPIIQAGTETPIATTIMQQTPNVVIPTVPPTISWLQIAAMVWISGLVVFLVFHGVKHYRFMKMTGRWKENVTDERLLMLLQNLKSEMGISKQISMFLCSSIGSPMMIGFINPRILLPKNDLSLDELRFILRHELIHYKRKDLWYKTLVLTATAMHWFNPIVYLMARAIEIQCELSCDYETVKREDADARLNYSETIIGVVKYHSKRRTAFSTNFYGGKKGMKNRIMSIMDFRKKKTGIIIICAMLILTMATSMAFAAKSSERSEQQINAQPINEGSNSMSSRVTDLTDDAMAAEYIRKGIKTDIKPYEPFGVSYDNKAGWMVYNGHPVREIYNPKDGMLITITAGTGFLGDIIPDGAIDLTAVYDGNVLSGLKVSTQAEFETRTRERLSMPQAAVYVTDSQTETQSYGVTYSVSDYRFDNAVVYAKYAEFGINYDKKTGKLFYKGELVRIFEDWYSVGEGMQSGNSYFEPDGMVDVRAVRDFSQIIHNADGSYDPSGKLVGVEAYSQEEFDARDIERQNDSALATPTHVASAVSEDYGSNSDGLTIAQHLEIYSKYGISYEENGTGGAVRNIYHSGQLVKHFLDEAPDGSIFMCSSSEGGTIIVRTVYDDSGMLTGVEVVKGELIS